VQVDQVSGLERTRRGNAPAHGTGRSVRLLMDVAAEFDAEAVVVDPGGEIRTVQTASGVPGRRILWSIRIGILRGSASVGRGRRLPSRDVVMAVLQSEAVSRRV